MSKWTTEGDSVLYDYDDNYVIQIVKNDKGLSIKTLEKNPPVGRTSTIYCKFINDSQLGIKFSKTK